MALLFQLCMKTKTLDAEKSFVHITQRSHGRMCRRPW